MRTIDLIVIHCSDSDIPAHDNAETIRGWHVKERKFSDIGYHYFIRKDGTMEHGRDESVAGAHVAGYNSRSIGICLSGRSKFTAAQFSRLEEIAKDICKRYALEKKDILAHNDLQPGKTCPNFDLHKLVSGWNW